MRLIRFEYKGTTRVALEIEGDQRKIAAMYCLQATKDDKDEVGYRSFKVADMRDIRPVEDQTAFLAARPEFLAGVQEELKQAEGSTSQGGRIKREGGKRGHESTNQSGRMRRPGD